MMDYYGQFDMPSLEERKKNLIKYGKIISDLNENELDHIITGIVSQTESFSYSGYSKYVITRIRKIKKYFKKIKDFRQCQCFFITV
jgi:hypothetical protein